MRKNGITLFFVLTMAALVPSCAWPARRSTACLGASAEMRRIVASLKVDLLSGDVEVSRMPVVRDADWKFFKTKNHKLEICHLPHIAAADIFTFTVYYDRAQGKYWVGRSGGFAGVAELYGPMKLK